MECAVHVVSHAPNEGVCEFAVSSKLRQLLGSSLSGIGPSISQDVSLISDGASDLTGVSSLNSIDEDKMMMFKTYIGPLPIHPRAYEFSLGTCCSRDLSVELGCGEEDDA